MLDEVLNKLLDDCFYNDECGCSGSLWLCYIFLVGKRDMEGGLEGGLDKDLKS